MEVEVEVEDAGGGSLKELALVKMEDFFQWYGQLVASRPFSTILICLLVTALAGLGLLRFNAENEGIKLWIPEDSDFRQNNDWLFENFPRSARFGSLILVADDVLTPAVIQSMYAVSRAVAGIRNKNNDTWESMCLRRPVIKPFGLTDFFGRRKRREIASGGNLLSKSDFFDDEWGEDEDWEDWDDLEDSAWDPSSSDLYPQPYCTLASNLPTACLEASILELWGNGGEYNAETDRQISQLSKQSILDMVNNNNNSGIFLTPTNFVPYLGGVVRDSQGRIVSARATTMRWIGNMNMTSSKLTPAEGRGEPIDPKTLDFEGDMLDVLLNTSLYPPGLSYAPNIARSFGDIAGSTILGDLGLFGGGYVMMFLYCSLMLGNLNCVEQRSVLSIAGIIGVGMGIVVSYGLCSAVGLFYGPMHSVMPFLMLGIGIDDMFVIVQCWQTLDKEARSRSMVERFGLAMRHAGSAITVTSLTDITAFGVGGLTKLPALKSFCIYAAVGILATFVFQSTFFVAVFSLDQRRQEADRNAFCPCLVHNNHQPNTLSQTEVQASLFSWLGDLLSMPIVKVLVIAITTVLLSAGAWGSLCLKQEFDPAWFLPPGTYLANWFQFNKDFFPGDGELGTVFFSGTPLPEQLEKVEALVNTLEAREDILREVDSWTTAYSAWMATTGFLPSNSSLAELPTTMFRKTLTQFLFSPAGAKYQPKFTFSKPLECGVDAPDVLLFEFTYTHKLFDGPGESIPAMNAVKNSIREANISGRVFAMAYGYSAWETDEVISFELYRNIGLALLCVFVVTLIFICDFVGALMIILCVFLTLVNVGGFMHFWGLTIDTVSCNNLIIAIGLCVDYSAHVTHRYLGESGTKDERLVSTLTNIGPAVFNGGVSTFLAFILLASSKSHVFITFFKIFFLVVSFGLFHGLFFLPVLLSLVGPKCKSRKTKRTAENIPMI